ncbi:hypothetical protein BV20DRAFT_786078 [Pilatotrama ljubarskyi]|nr:hypothetical protein BV20DRAFT_786078 [Pilatotrama ljubarskyi]
MIRSKQETIFGRACSFSRRPSLSDRRLEVPLVGFPCGICLLRLKAHPVPERLQSHPGLRRRGLVLADPLKPGFVYTASHLRPPQYAVKIINAQELAVYERLLEVGPASFFELGGARRTLYKLLGFFSANCQGCWVPVLAQTTCSASDT